MLYKKFKNHFLHSTYMCTCVTNRKSRPLSQRGIIWSAPANHMQRQTTIIQLHEKRKGESVVVQDRYTERQRDGAPKPTGREKRNEKQLGEFH